jgi:hypothetical protein
MLDFQCYARAQERLVSGYTVNSQDVCMFEKRVMCLWIKISVEKGGDRFYRFTEK